jgi:hypothetical protein
VGCDGRGPPARLAGLAVASHANVLWSTKFSLELWARRAITCSPQCTDEPTEAAERRAYPKPTSIFGSRRPMESDCHGLHSFRGLSWRPSAVLVFSIRATGDPFC